MPTFASAVLTACDDLGYLVGGVIATWTEEDLRSCGWDEERLRWLQTAVAAMEAVAGRQLRESRMAGVEAELERLVAVGRDCDGDCENY